MHNAINPNLLYERGTLQDVLGGAYASFVRATKAGSVRCVRKHNETWVTGEDVMAWLAADGGLVDPAKVVNADPAPATTPAPTPTPSDSKAPADPAK